MQITLWQNTFVKGSMATVLLSLLQAASGCKSRSFNSNESDAQAAKKTPPTAAELAMAQEFYKGLDAKPGSAERKRAGVLLEQEVLKKAFGNLPNSKDADTVKWQKRTLKILGFTAQYLQKSAGCEDSKKVRLYRGHGYTAELQADHKTFQTQFSNAWHDQIKKEADGLNTLPWPIWFAKVRNFITPEGGDTVIEPKYRFDRLAEAHTIDSKASALISTTSSEAVARNFGTQVFVLNMCPERIFPVMDTRYFNEFESYVPLFILPEEIVAEVAKASAIPTGLPAISDTTQNLWRCFANTGSDLDIRALREEAETVKESGGDDTRDGLPYVQRYKGFRDQTYNVLDSTTDFASWRSAYATATASCQISCDLVKATLEKEKARAVALGSSFTADDKAILNSYEKTAKDKCKL